MDVANEVDGNGHSGGGKSPTGNSNELKKHIVEWLCLFVQPGQVIELRAVGVTRSSYRKPHIEAGFFDFEHLDAMASAALSVSGQAKGVYFTLNPPNRDLLARRCNRIDVASEGELTKDKDILGRRWLYIDVDPVRDPLISATDAEKAAALGIVQGVRTYLRAQNWPEAILSDSGNGYHALYRVDLPADDQRLVERILSALAARFNTEQAKVDCTVFNPARICKLPGTRACKGDHTNTRPHRLARPLDIPESLRPVPMELLEAVAARADRQTRSEPARAKADSHAEKSSPNNGTFKSRLLVDQWLQARGAAFRIKDAKASGDRTVYILDRCPFNPDHGSSKEVCIMQAPDGKMSAKCMHDGCAGRSWQDFKNAIGPPDGGYYDPPLPTRRAVRTLKLKSDLNDEVAGATDVEEMDADPHRLARVFLKGRESEADLTHRYYRGEHYDWDGKAYVKADDKELRATVTRAIKREFNLIAVIKAKMAQKQAEEEERETGEKKEAQPPVVKPVGKEIVSNTIQALESLTVLPSAITAPAWIDPPDTIDGAEPSRFTPPFDSAETVAFQNGLLHLPTFLAGDACEARYIIDPTPRFFSPNVMDYSFRLDAPKPACWLDFLLRVWPTDQEAIDTLQEWFGYCLLPDTRQQKILLLVGPRRGGKGTIARIQRGLIGINNTAAPTLASLGQNFGLAPLLGKTLAIISDARLSGRTDTAIVTERLLSISGEDAQTIDRKYLNQITTKLPTRFMILTNELPRLNDPSGALVGRMIVLQLKETWYGREDITLTDRLLTELPGIFLWAAEGWKRLRDRGHFQQPQSGRKAIDALEDLSSPIGAFLRDCCLIGREYEEEACDLFQRWKLWAEDKGNHHGTEQTFGRDLRAALPSIDMRQPRLGGGRIRVYVGLRLRRPEDE